MFSQSDSTFVMNQYDVYNTYNIYNHILLIQPITLHSDSPLINVWHP